MLHVDLRSQPQRRVLWDETHARYIWLDPSFRRENIAVAAAKAAYHAGVAAVSQPSALADLWHPSEFSADTRHRAKSKVRRSNKRKAENARASGAPLAGGKSRLPALTLTDIASHVGRAIAAL